jgi:hypothetical protein
MDSSVGFCTDICHVKNGVPFSPYSRCLTSTWFRSEGNPLILSHQISLGNNSRCHAGNQIIVICSIPDPLSFLRSFLTSTCSSPVGILIRFLSFVENSRSQIYPQIRHLLVFTLLSTTSSSKHGESLNLTDKRTCSLQTASINASLNISLSFIWSFSASLVFPHLSM